MKKLIFALIIILIPATASAGGQYVIKNYNDAKKNFFWNKLYNNGGQSIYCDIKFNPGEKLTIEHVYPASWVVKFHGCVKRETCKAVDFLRAYGDLHNLWPADGGINSSRGNSPYKEIPGEDNRKFKDKCPDYERTSKTATAPAFVEPQDDVKGDIARSLFYMRTEYGLPLHGMLPMLKKWNRQDPPDEAEHLRNDRIGRLQKTRNKFIDNYFRGNSLFRGR